MLRVLVTAQAFLLLITSGFFIRSFAQEKQSVWQHQLGYEHILLSDQQNSPLLYQSNNLNIATDFLSVREASQHKISIQFSLGNNQSKRHGQRVATLSDPVDMYGVQESWETEANPSLSLVNINLSYAYLSKLSLGGTSLYLGAEISDNFYQTGIGLDNWFFNGLSLGPKLAKTFNHKKLSFPLEISFPLIAAITSTPYAKDPSKPVDSYFTPYLQETRIALPDQFRRLNFSLSVRITTHEEKVHSLGVMYQFYGLGYYYYEPLRMISNSFSIVYQH
ncbi:hypothetical protein WJR50_01970 [Catalinimonas sp. 4WD22]|uniref:hypothetical protein n=1 Tax=Catalinimonas locisalis TaxID=3133978 RepID=UPI0031015C24